MKTLISLADFQAAVRSVVERQGADWTYRYSSPVEGTRAYTTMCYYSQPEQDDPRLNACGCLIGEALRVLGVPESGLRRLDPEGRIGTLPAIRVLSSEGWRFDPDALEWAGHVQKAQDLGASWGKAVETADGAL